METKFNFNSQICTTREQSERLIALGLKKETADMYRGFLAGGEIIMRTEETIVPIEEADLYKFYDKPIPAWSLNRLIELKQPNKIDNAVIILSREQTYDKLIDMIAKSIEGGKFPKEYLEE